MEPAKLYSKKKPNIHLILYNNESIVGMVNQDKTGSSTHIFQNN